MNQNSLPLTGITQFLTINATLYHLLSKLVNLDLMSRPDMTHGRQSSPYGSLPIELDSRCIRLLRIHPPVSDHDEMDPIRCDLFVADLAANPTYTALSYVWGVSASEPHEVNCGDFAISVTANGHSALVHLRRKLGGFIIWMDAVCISK